MGNKIILATGIVDCLDLRAAVRKYQAFGGRTREINFAHFLATKSL